MKKLGKQQAVYNPNVKKFELITAGESLIIPPKQKIWMPEDTVWPMWMNDKLSCCTATSVASAIMTWTTVAQSPIVLTDAQVVSIYKQSSAYRGTPETDLGANEDNVITKWLTEGFPQHGQTLDYLAGRATISPVNIQAIKQAIALTGGLYIGLQLPQFALDRDGDWHDYRNLTSYDMSIAGGHAMWAHGYDEEFIYSNTWAKRKKMDWEFFYRYCDEAHVLVNRLDWQDVHYSTPSGKTIDQIRAALI